MSLRNRVVLSMLCLVAVSGGVAGLIGGHLLWQSVAQEAQDRVRQDLNAATEFYSQRMESMAAALRYTALGERFIQAASDRDISYLAPRLEAISRNAGMDVLYLTDEQGRVILRVNQSGSAGDSAAEDRLVRDVLARGQTVTGTLLVPMEVLARESPSLAERAKIRILPTPKAVPSDADETSAGMMLCAAAPLCGPDGRLLGVLRGGTLLNRNFDLVDQVQGTVFRGEQFGGQPLGTATIFQNDVRISTNVLQEDGSRAIGTRVSTEVYDQVLRQQKAWLGRAWVVNAWYLSAYAPISDPDGRPIGMLYVGVQERKFDEVAYRTLATFALVTLAGLFVAGLVAWRLAESISRPVRGLVRAAEAVAKGSFAETAAVGSDDEIGTLARTFNDMARSLNERDKLLKEQTRMQLTRSERLAAVGRLAAGVAHEINNPLTGVLTFAHMLLKEAPPNSRQREDVETILEATMRCRDIIRGLLNFSRQSEPHKRPCDLREVLREALNLTRNQAHLHRVSIEEDTEGDLPPLLIDPFQIQEVAVNIILNAIDAMPDGGRLTVTARAGAPPSGLAGWAEFQVADTGIGIPAENLERIFDPFFTTKPPGKGTGLGLAISYGIITEHGGEIRVASQVDRGTTVTVRLPVDAKEKPDESQGANPGHG